MFAHKKVKCWYNGLSICLVVLMLGTTVYAEGKIKIGIIGPMKYKVGKWMFQGAQIAADDINKGGGVIVKGMPHKIELVEADSNEYASIGDAVSATERIITVDKVDFVMGAHRSEAALAMQEVTSEYKKIFFNSGAGTSLLATRIAENYDKYKYWFRLSSLGCDVGAAHIKLWYTIAHVAAEKVRSELGIKIPRVALLVETGTAMDYFVKLHSTFFPFMDMEVVGIWRVSSQAKDFTSELTAITAAHPHIVYAMVSGAAGVILSRQFGETKVPAILVGNLVESMGGEHWKETGGRCNYEVTWNDPGTIRIPATPKSIYFFDKYVSRFKAINPSFFSAAMYDNFFVLAGAIKRANTLDSDKLVTELEKTDYMGVIGRVTFYPRGHQWPHDIIWGPRGITAIIVQWQDGKLEAVWPDGKPNHPLISSDPEWIGLKYKGTGAIKLPPWMVEYWKGKKG